MSKFAELMPLWHLYGIRLLKLKIQIQWLTELQKIVLLADLA
jgi:hypothetical protein